MRKNETATPSRETPEIYIARSSSPSNSRGEIEKKILALLEYRSGGRDNGTVRHFAADGLRRLSQFIGEEVSLNCT